MSKETEKFLARFFEFEQGIPSEGKVWCPVCGKECCTLKKERKYSSGSIFEQAQAISEGKEYHPPERDMGWVCSGGCTRTQKHSDRKTKEKKFYTVIDRYDLPDN